MKAPFTSATFSNTGSATSTVSDPSPSNNSATVSVSVKAVVCPLPAGQTTLAGMVQWKMTDSLGLFENFQFMTADGTSYTVLTNFYDGTAPLTNVINLSCQQTPVQLIQVGGTVSVTGVVGSAVLGISTAATPVIYASVVQVPFFKDKI